jgi:hypothetical protein
MLATELLFVYVYCLVDDAIKAGALLIPRRPGPAPDCTDAELLTIALVRHLLGRRSENGFLAEIRRDWPGLFPHLPDQPEVNRRTRWLWGAFEQLRAALGHRGAAPGQVGGDRQVQQVVPLVIADRGQHRGAEPGRLGRRHQLPGQ